MAHFARSRADCQRSLRSFRCSALTLYAVLMPRRSLLFAVLLAAWWASPTVKANGRFPTADQLVVDPDDSEHLAMGTTFGVLVSTNGGEDWRWICEEAVGYAGDEHPVVAIVDGGTLLAGLRRGLWASEDDGCTWARTQIADPVLDVVIRPNTPGQMLVLTATTNDRRCHVYSVDGVFAEPVELTSPGDDLWPTTIDVAPSDPDRLYVAAQQTDAQFVLFRSSDGGASWEAFDERPYASLPAYVSAVDPNDSDRLYVRVDGESTDHLLVSTDGGESFSEVLAVDTDMLGFALSPDGERLAAGGPREGVFLADAASLSFRPAAGLVSYLSCLKWTPSDLLACAREQNDAWTVGASSDGGNRFRALFHLQDLSPQECESDTITAAECSIAWESVAPSLGIELERDTEMSRDDGREDAGCGCLAVGAVQSRFGGLNRASIGMILLLACAVARSRKRQCRRCSHRPALRRTQEIRGRI